MQLGLPGVLLECWSLWADMSYSQVVERQRCDSRQRNVADDVELRAQRTHLTQRNGTTMRVPAVNPILNVSDIATTISWFANLGWTVGFEWQDDPEDPNSPVDFARSRAASTRSSSAGVGRAAV